MGELPRILQVNKLYYPYIGGVETVLQNLAEQIRDRCELDVLVCQLRGRGSRDTVNGVRVARAGSLGIWLSMPISPSYPFLLRKMVQRADLVHFHHPFPLGELSALAFNTRARMVCTWHSAIVRQKWLARAYRPFLERFLDRIHAIILTYPGAERTSELLAASAHKCRAIPLGIDVRRYDLDDTLAREAQKIRSTYGDNLVLFVGRLVYYKGLQHLIAAMASVAGKLLLVGEGPLRATIERQTFELGIADRVCFLGRLDDRQLKAVFHACDVFVLPSTHPSEAFGMVQLEAMACRKPVVNTRLATGVPYVSLDGETGLTVPVANSEALANAISKLLNDADLRARFGENGRKRVLQEFTVQVMAERTFRLYEQVLGGEV